MAGTFISYRREDSAGYAGRLHEALERRLGQGSDIFRDVDTLQPGQDFVRAIDERVRQCDVFLALIGREWRDARDASGRRRLEQAHDYVRIEIASALTRQDLLVIPVLVEGATMPAPEDLPSAIRTLAFRHALSVRDETWDADIDRLAALIENVDHEAPQAPVDAARKPARVRPWWLAAAAIAIVIVVGAWLLGRGGRLGDRDASANGTFDADGKTGPAIGGAAHAIRIPRIAEVVHGNVIYTVLSASVEPRGSVNTLRVRIRASNDGRYAANFWDDSFRFASDSGTVAPTSGVNQVLAGHSIDQAIITFDLPPRATRGALRISKGDAFGAVPLDLAPTGRAPEDENADAGDALSRALVFAMQREPTPFVTDGDLTIELRRATGRRFANAVRLTFTLLFNNRGRYPRGSGDAVLRISAGDRVLAPVESPNEVIEPLSTVIGDYVFDVPPATRDVVVRLMVRDESAEMPFNLPVPGAARGAADAVTSPDQPRRGQATR